MKHVDIELKRYVEETILPQYENFDAAHRCDHVEMVIRQSLDIAEALDVDVNMVYAIAAYHDTGLCEGREYHHEVSARIIREDLVLRRWFTQHEIDVIADAAEDHRASAVHAPRSVYGRIVAEADRFIDPVTIVRRTIQYGLGHYPSLNREEHYLRMMCHLHEKYGRGGYLHLWFPDSPNAKRLAQLQEMMKDERLMRQMFDELWPSKL